DANTMALYHFDEGAGDVLKDSSGNNHHGKIIGATWEKADGAIAAPTQRSIALSFNGKDASVDVPSLRFDGSHPITFEAWVQPERLPPQGSNEQIAGWDSMLAMRTVPTGVEALVYAKDLKSKDGWSTGAARAALPLQDWQRLRHVATVWNGRKMDLYLDGKFQ